jgi:NDP-4-keto-2,6-dideoxyhexose 3-C-methyltransferase
LSTGPILRIAYEPATNLHEELSKHCSILETDYFPGTANTRWSFAGKVKILTSIACFYAVDDPVGFVKGIDELLAPEGVWIVQFQDLCQMLQATAFDDICHEHLFYPSLASVERLLTPFDLKVIHAERREINGGSLRVVVGRRAREAKTSVETLRAAEAGCEEQEMMCDFVHQVEKSVKLIKTSLLCARGAGHVVDAYGASTKGNILLQVCGLGPELVRQVWERAEEKVGHKTITGIPIVSEQVGRADPPGLLFAVIWQFREAILQREMDYLLHGGQILFALPSVEIVSKRNFE